MFARKDIFAKPSITQVCGAHIGLRPKACSARLSAYIIPQTKMFARKDIFVPCVKSAGARSARGRSPKCCKAKFSAYIIPQFFYWVHNLAPPLSAQHSTTPSGNIEPHERELSNKQQIHRHYLTKTDFQCTICITQKHNMVHLSSFRIALSDISTACVRG